jgi:hypothetical protein
MLFAPVAEHVANDMTLGELIGIVGAGIALIGFIFTLMLTTGRLGKMAGALEAGLQNQNTIIRELKDEVVSLRKVVTDLAVFNSRLEYHSQEMARLSQGLDEIRHGRGFIVPFSIEKDK